MARKAKIPKFDYFNAAPNCFGILQDHKGTWQDYLGVGPKLTVEIGCARAELSMELARRYPDENFIGVDKKSDRMWRPAKTAIEEEKLKNIAFIQADSSKLEEYFQPQTVDVIWVTFPDPQPRKRGLKHRLVNTKFMTIYKTMLKKDGLIRFKTDDLDLFNFFVDEVLPGLKNCEVLTQSNDLHGSELPEEYKIMTAYERKWIQMGRKINFIEIKFN